MTRRIAVVGAGPAGLAGAFWRLHDDPTADVVVLESGKRCGGWVQTQVHQGFRCEYGPQAIRPSPELDALAAALGLQDRLRPASPTAKSRWIGRGGRLLPVPKGPVQLLRSPLLSLRGKLRLLKEPFVRGGDPTGEGLTSFVRRRFGAETAPLVQAMISGIFAGDADLLEVESAFPMLAVAEREAGSVLKGMRARRKRAAAAGEPKRPRPAAALYSFDGGMSELIGALVERLGDRVHTAARIQTLRRIGSYWRLEVAGGCAIDADEVVLACPASQSARIVADLDGELAQDLAAIPYASVASVWLGFPCAAPPPTLEGFGFLLEPGEESPVLGAIYVGSLFPDHAPEGHALVRVMLGGRRHPAAVDEEDAALIELARATVARYTGHDLAPTFTHVARARDGIAQYEHGHAARMHRIEQRLAAHPGLTLRGNSYKQIALAGQLGRASGTDEAKGGEPREAAGAASA